MTDFALSENAYHMRPGYLTVHRNQMMVYGVVGSGVFVGLFDMRNRYSGCCCFQYPRSPQGGASSRYGDKALRHLVDRMKRVGSSPQDLRAHVIGGGVRPGNLLGEQNANAALEVLHELNVAIDSTDTGGSMGRKYVYDTATGEHMIMKVHSVRSKDWNPVN